MTHTLRYCRVVLDTPVFALDRPFDYAIPDRMVGRVRPGCVVRVRVHGRRMRAYVLELLDAPAVADPRPLSELVSEQPLFAAAELELAAWTARRYVAPVGQVLHHAVPGRYSAPATQSPPEADRAPAAPVAPDAAEPDAPPDDGSAGAAPLVAPGRQLVVQLPHAHAATSLAVEVAAACDGQLLVVCGRVDVAERIASAIPAAALLHGGLRPAKRAAAWASARDGSARVVVGGRAALFAPMPDLRCVLVAAAHDRTLKEERTPRLHAIPVARERARLAGAAFIAASPAPPLDLAVSGDIEWVRPGPGHAVRVRPEIVAPRPGPVTARLVDVIRSAVERGTDALVFVGRRGHVLRIRCRECGWYPRCRSCASGVSFADRRRLRCRVCGSVTEPPSSCPSCGGTDLDGRGWGAERVAEELSATDLGAPVVRVDADTAPSPPRPHPAVLVGTMAAAWTLEPASAGAVCVADLDQLLGLPDFRAAEHALHTLHDLSEVLAPDGRFLVQTREPEHHAVQAFARASHAWFCERELPLRRAARYPPFAHVIRLEAPADAVEDLHAAATAAGGSIVGPLPRGAGRVAALLRVSDVWAAADALRAVATRRGDLRIDVDPVDVL